MTRSALSSSHFCARRMIRPRPAKPSASHPGCAARALAAISLTSSGPRSGTVAMTWPVAGFSTSMSGRVFAPLADWAAGASVLAMDLSLLDGRGRLTHEQSSLHALRGVAGLDADERVAARPAQLHPEGERLAGHDVRRDRGAEPAWPDDLEVVGVLAVVVHVEAHGAGGDAGAVDAEAVLARADADRDGGVQRGSGEGGDDHRVSASRPKDAACGITSAASVPIHCSSSEQ